MCCRQIVQVKNSNNHNQKRLVTELRSCTRKHGSHNHFIRCHHIGLCHFFPLALIHNGNDDGFAEFHREWAIRIGGMDPMRVANHLGNIEAMGDRHLLGRTVWTGSTQITRLLTTAGAGHVWVGSGLYCNGFVLCFQLYGFVHRFVHGFVFDLPRYLVDVRGKALSLLCHA